MSHLTLKVGFFFSLLLLANVARAGVLVIQFSDSHSYYPQVPDFLRTVSVLARSYKKQNPDGRVLIVANGDIAGVSEWAEFEKGAFSYEILARLASLYDVVVTLGNHEGLDLVDAQNPPHAIFIAQNQKLIRDSGGAKLLAANIGLTPLGQTLVEPYRDFSLGSHGRLRVIGMTVRDFFRESIYQFERGEALFLSKQPEMFAEAQRLLLAAARDGISQVIFQIHDMTEVVLPLAQKILEWKQTQPELAGLPIPLFGAGHKHEVHALSVGTQGVVVEAGEHYAFSTVEINDAGQAGTVNHWSHQRQREFLKNFKNIKLHATERALIQKAQAIVAPIQRENQRVLAAGMKRNVPLDSSPQSVTLRRGIAGQWMARSLESWAKRYFQDPANGQQGLEPVGLFNSLSYWDLPALFSGENLTLGTIKKLIPFNDPPVVRVVTGAVVQQIYTAMRAYGQNSPAPFLTPITASGNLRALDAEREYLLVTDRWTGINGYRLDVLSQAYAQSRWEWKTDNAPRMRKILEAELGQVLSSCTTLLEPL